MNLWNISGEKKNRLNEHESIYDFPEFHMWLVLEEYFRKGRIENNVYTRRNGYNTDTENSNQK